MDKGRQADIDTLKEALKTANSKQKKLIEEAGQKIREEQQDGFTRSAREALIKVSKYGQGDDTKRISEDIMKMKNSKSFYFDLTGIK